MIKEEYWKFDKIMEIYNTSGKEAVKHILKEIKGDDNNWSFIHNEFCLYAPITEEFVNDFPDFIVWNKVSDNTSVSEDFLRKFQDKLSWNKVGKWKHLSVDFMIEFHEKLNFRSTIKCVPKEVEEFLISKGFIKDEWHGWYKPN